MRISLTLLLWALLFSNATARAQTVARLDGGSATIEFDRSLHSRLSAKLKGKLTSVTPSARSESLRLRGSEPGEFTFHSQQTATVNDQFGSGRRLTVRGTAPVVSKTVTSTVYRDFPRMIFLEVAYTNAGKSDLVVEGWTNHEYAVPVSDSSLDPPFWSFQSGSYSKRPDWVLPLRAAFRQENFLGMNAADYGGGTPIVDVWRKDWGIGVGHVEPAPKLISLPVAMPDAKHATVAVRYKMNRTLKAGETLKTFRTFVALHEGDYFQVLADYRRVMERQGLNVRRSPESAFGPIWCAWGYGREFVPSQVYGALPAVKKLGFTWVTLDDGWQTSQGDWALLPEKFPRGDADMRALVDKIHAEGFKAQLWWAPLTGDPGSELAKAHPEMLLLNADGSKQQISYWNSWYLCPAHPEVIEYHRKLVVKMMKDWGYDGLKLDGQHMNAAPPCYNLAHGHARPEESVEAMPLFFKAIYDAALAVKPDAVIEFCPCGTAYSYFTLPYMNMSVASDPTSSWQIRTKGKTLKALHGDAVAYFGDHVELSDGGLDFASSVGVGGVVGTNFTWPPGSARRNRLDLTAERENLFAHWIGLYREKMLSRGEYLGGLYDIGFDRPETHAIRKGETMYYAFYAPSWEGKVRLRGLANRQYRIVDYERRKDLGMVRGPTGSLDVVFDRHLLLQAEPQ
jgi:alpha-galactosidase